VFPFPEKDLKKKICLITHLPLQPSGGGVYAVSWNVSQQLQKHFQLLLPPPIETPIDRLAQLSSRIRRRLLRRPGEFFSFSRRVLDKIARKVDRSLSADADAVFFRTSTRWSHCRPNRPYFVHTDASFHTFFHNTFRPEAFLESDTQRIFQAEAQFLDEASAVFFESRWGLEKARKAYGISGKNFVTSRIAGGLTAPVCDSRKPDGFFRLVTIAKHFRQKGGDLVASAYNELKSRYPQLSWTIIGGPPDVITQTLADVSYAGFLHADRPADVERFRQCLAQADLLVHPTREDTNPLVLAEAAAFGCPCITVKAFAIPELVEDQVTGILLPQPTDPTRLSEAIEHLIMNPARLAAMRRAARERALRLFQWDSIGNEIATEIHKSLAPGNSD
jgi:glycosyltransferase involved in cell wall biosynthesis